ncbi:hypothetical protein MMC07_003443 [Pseudocyphellaria aurata]|nr:hypothetical protein [Pseudocyphellaria aurata]
MFGSTKKRSRAPDEDAVQESENDCKKPRTLPFRTSPTVKHTLLFSQSTRSQPRPLLTPSITPVESSDDEDERPPQPSSAPSPDQSSCQVSTNTYDVDLDMEMMDSQPPGTPPQWNDTIPTSMSTLPQQSSFATLAKPSRHSQDTDSGGRIPTPRWGHFRSIDTSIDMYDGTDTANHSPTGSSQSNGDHNLFLRRRRLPTPISEDEDMVSPTGMTEDTGERTNMITMPALGPSSWDQFSEGKDNMTSLASLGPRAGRTVLSMGYRADCEKCRTRVPGHYNHVIQT